MISMIVLIGLLWLGFIVNETFAEESILITEANSIQEIDGKWGFVNEWKESAYTGLSYDNGEKLVLRTLHDRNYIYVLVDHLGDTHPNKGEDRAIVCLNSKNENPEKDNYCFIVTLGRKNSIVLQESTSFTINSKFKRIFKTEFEGMGGVTVADRYSTIPHVTYEFKIPVELVGKSNEYQFYVAAYEAQRNYILTWPKNIILKNNFDIPLSSNWGTMISPDSSLPEFPLSLSVLIIPMVMIIVISRMKVDFLNK
jgi:hypothetical protein